MGVSPGPPWERWRPAGFFFRAGGTRPHSPPWHNPPAMPPLKLLALLAAAAGAGIMNAMAGGGTILVFPALLLLGQPSIGANATATVGLLPGAAASLFGYRREVA